MKRPDERCRRGGTFKPYGSLSRAMIVTILYRQEGSPYASGSGFRDVPSNQYYSAAVAWASENGIVNGYIDGSFRPNDAVSMQEMHDDPSIAMLRKRV